MGLYTYENNAVMRTIIRIFVYIAVVISAAWFFVYSFMNQAIVTGNSMSPVLEAEDMCLINRLCYDLGNPKRYDVIAFNRQDTGKQNIKRIVALPGETVQILDGYIYIDGEELENSFTSLISLPGIADNVIELSEDEYFVIGDNADSSEDSRFANIGNVKRSSINGKLWLIIKPFKRFGRVL